MNTNNNEKLDITRVLNLSTAHITKNTAETLCRCALNNDYIPLCTVLEKGEYGWYVYINDSEEPDQIPDELSDIRDCVIFALKHDITCICFDRDADTVVGLPVYNWKDTVGEMILAEEKENKILKAINIKWDTDGDVELLKSLPTEMDIPEYLIDENTDVDGYEEDISDWLSNQVGFCHNGFELVEELSQNYIDILEENDWTISSYCDDGKVELEKHSPLGEDFVMCVKVVNFPDSVREYANDFDTDEHAEMWIEGRGRNGVPESVKELIEDAYAIKQMIYELADALEGKEKPDMPEYYNTSKLSQKIFDALSDGYDDEEGREQAETGLYNELSQIEGNSVIRAAIYRLCERIEELEG